MKNQKNGPKLLGNLNDKPPQLDSLSIGRSQRALRYLGFDVSISMLFTRC